MTLYDLMIAFGVALLGFFIWENAGYRDRAIAIAKQQCEHQDVQLLDDTIALLSVKLKRDARGNFAVTRSYEFEFTSTGDQRYHGQLILHGKRLLHVELQPHRIH